MEIRYCFSIVCALKCMTIVDNGALKFVAVLEYTTDGIKCNVGIGAPYFITFVGSCCIIQLPTKNIDT